MLQKVTAWMLALLIASPMCWCGWMHSAPAAEAAVAAKPSCCHDKKESKKAASDEANDCPCAHAPKARELTSSKILVPSASMAGDALALWEPMMLVLDRPAVTVRFLDNLHAQGPPLRTEPLFVRHCSWLI